MSWVVYKSTLRLDDLLEGLIGLRKAVILMVVFITEERFTLKSEEMVHGVRSRRNCKPPAVSPSAGTQAHATAQQRRAGVASQGSSPWP